MVPISESIIYTRLERLARTSKSCLMFTNKLLLKAELFWNGGHFTETQQLISASRLARFVLPSRAKLSTKMRLRI